MKRLWIGVVLMALLLAGGIWEFRWLETTYKPAAAAIEQAEEMAQNRDLDGAAALTRSVQRTWNTKKHIAAAFVPHDMIDEIEGLFARLELYQAGGDAAAYAVSCTQLSMLLDALGNVYTPTWWNLL